MIKFLSVGLNHQLRHFQLKYVELFRQFVSFYVLCFFRTKVISIAPTAMTTAVPSKHGTTEPSFSSFSSSTCMILPILV